MQWQASSELDWRDGASYAALLGADRSLFAWEWLRRDPAYRAAVAGLPDGVSTVDAHAGAALFGLVAFEDPSLSVPNARPVWRSDVHPRVLTVEAGDPAEPEDVVQLDQLAHLATLVRSATGEHVLLSDGLRTIRLDGPPSTFSCGPLTPCYRIAGIVSADPRVLTLRRFLALCRTGRFARSLHHSEPRARRWILMLRAADALLTGADQREIARVLLGSSAGEPRWRSREPSLRSQAQRLVRSARSYEGDGYARLLRETPVRGPTTI